MQHCLSAEKHFPSSIRAQVRSPVVGQWLQGREKLHALVHRQFDHFIEAGLRSKFGRVARRERARLELQVANRRQGCRGGNRRTRWIGFRLGRTLLALQQRSGKQDKRRGA